MKIPIEPPPWEGCADVKATWVDGGYRRFALTGRTDIISTEVLGGDLLVYPERSSGQKALVAALGLNTA
jgi:hypothetical protein